MTPDQARRLLDGTTPGPWEVDHDHAWAPGVWSPDGIVFGPYYDREDMEQWEAGNAADLRLAAAAPVLAAMIAGMRAEYRTEEWQGSYSGWVPTSPWIAEKPVGSSGPHTRVVRRYVPEPEEA